MRGVCNNAGKKLEKYYRGSWGLHMHTKLNEQFGCFEEGLTTRSIQNDVFDWILDMNVRTFFSIFVMLSINGMCCCGRH